MTLIHIDALTTGSLDEPAGEHTRPIPLAAGPTTLRELLRAVVRAEVTAYRERRESERVVRILTGEEVAAGLLRGAVHSGGRTEDGEVSAEDAVRVALEAQVDGLFHVVVDGVPTYDLDATIEVYEGMRVMFVRLVPLAGG